MTHMIDASKLLVVVCAFKKQFMNEKLPHLWILPSQSLSVKVPAGPFKVQTADVAAIFKRLCDLIRARELGHHSVQRRSAQTTKRSVVRIVRSQLCILSWLVLRYTLRLSRRETQKYLSKAQHLLLHVVCTSAVR